MNRDDFVKLVGVAVNGAEYLPVAFLLRSRYACAGYYHAAVNEDLVDTCVLLNARLIELQGDGKVTGQPSINDFNDFLEEVVVDFCKPEGRLEASPKAGSFGKSIPLTAIPFDEIAVVYPVAHIGALVRRAEQQQMPQAQKQPRRLPTFFDLDKSEVIQLLRTKLW
jgi:hypothetical protein